MSPSGTPAFCSIVSDEGEKKFYNIFTRWSTPKNFASSNTPVENVKKWNKVNLNNTVKMHALNLLTIQFIINVGGVGVGITVTINKQSLLPT